MTEAGRPREHATKAPAEYEVAIVGGGPAGLTAGVWLGRYLHSVVLIDAGDPRNWETRGVNGYLGLPKITPAELRKRGRQECERFGVHLVDDEVLQVSRQSASSFRLVLRSGEQLLAPRVLLAIGIRDVWPDVPGLARAYGDTVHVCPDCDGYEARGKKTVIIGSGKKAVHLALAMTTWTSEIIICTNGAPARIDKDLCGKLDRLNIPVLESRIRQVSATGGDVYAVHLEQGMNIDCERIFFGLGQLPADDLGTQLGCKRDHDGLIEIDERGATSVEHVYAAGDIAPRPQLTAVAAASGAVAALSIHRSLLPDARRLD
jgi:thioredoxin reductase (NADPH)